MYFILFLFSCVSACDTGFVFKDGECQVCEAGRFFQQTPVSPVVNLGESAHNDFYENGEYNIPRCGADCDQDDHCAGDLICFQRENGEIAPGCSLGPSEPSDADICISEIPPEFSTPSFMYVLDCGTMQPFENLCYDFWDEWDNEYCGGDGWAPGGYVEYTEGMTSSTKCRQQCATALTEGALGAYDNSPNSYGFGHVASYKYGLCRCHVSTIDVSYCEANRQTESGYKVLVMATKNRHRRLMECEGSCESDDDCADDLVCHFRLGSEYHTPGCIHTTIDNDVNVCYDPIQRQYECADCLIMTYQPLEGSHSCIVCPDNTYSYEYGATQCEPCSETPMSSPISGGTEACCLGYGLENGTCSLCPVGQMALGIMGAQPCTTCESGKVAVKKKPVNYDLSYTYFGTNGSNFCHDCPDGTHVLDHKCSACPSGKWESNHACLSCALGTYSNEVGTTGCKTCPSGFYMNEMGAQFCKPCMQNTLAQFEGSIACSPCGAGLKSPTASSQCYVTCPANTFGETCERCVPGKYYDGDCKTCPSGKVKEFDYQNACYECMLSIASSDQTSCESCLPGKYLSDQSCVECGQGTYGEPSGESLLFCTNCPQGYAQPTTGQSTCNACESGKYSLTEIECVTCPAGRIAPSQGVHFCEECAAGKGANASIECVSCTPGTGTVAGVCQKCPFGKFSETDTCYQCPPGSISDQLGATICEKCPVGYYSLNSSFCGTCNQSNQEYPNLFGSGSTHCVACSDPNVACQECGSGKYSDGQQCIDCPENQVNNGNRFCSTCPDFSVPNDAKSECVGCPSGFQKQGSACVECPAGRYGASLQCEDCPKGQFAPAVASLQCVNCEEGKTTESSGSIQPSSCKTCQQLGHASVFVVINSECSECLAGGVFSPDSGDCVQCPNGQHRTITQTVCTECLPGWFSNDGEPCEECPTGYYNIQSGETYCQLCIAQSDASSHCDECAAGYKRSNGNCVACASGKYSTVGQTECALCAIGQYQQATAATNCLNCEIGRYQSEEGKLECKECPLGYFQPMGSQGACHACPVSKYAIATGSDKCEACPSGTVTHAEGSTSASACVSCPSGFMEHNGICMQCVESQWQDLEGQTTCKNCPSGKISPRGSTSVQQCFSLDGMVSYVFGMKTDSKAVQKYTKTCEIRPNSVLLCPACTCDSDSRNGFWASPICDECQRGFATRLCTVKCAGYNGVDDDTMCNGNGKCWYGKFGSGLCYCGGLDSLDTSSGSVVVDVRLCPKGQICPNYGLTKQTETSYRPIYYMILYRQYSAFVLQLNDYTPERGHMWFKRYSPASAYENDCQACVSSYQQNALTSIGYWSAEGTYKYFEDSRQTQNGFHGENCQYECALCLHGGRCQSVPHPYRYTYTMVDSYRPQNIVSMPSTFCICPSISMDSGNMCCPNGFQPYVYFGPRNTWPYSRFTEMPYISSIVNARMDNFIGRDILLEPDKRVKYAEPVSGLQWKSLPGGQFVKGNYSTVGAYNTHPYYGSSKDICRPCPGLFGRGVRSQSVRIESVAEATEFWWDNAIGASSRKCNGIGVCDFYAKDKEMEVHFMGNADSYFKESSGHICNGASTSFATYQDAEGIQRPISNIQQCGQLSREAGHHRFAYGESYFGGSLNDMDGSVSSHEFYAEQRASSIGSMAIAAFQNDTGKIWFVLSPNRTQLPPPDINSLYEIHTVGMPICLSFASCTEFVTQPGYATYRHEQGRGRERSPTSTYDRFDTCFTYNWNKTVTVMDLYSTSEYKQGEDPFLGGLCPSGHFCSMYENIGYKEECPIGYFQPDEGRTRTRVDVQCSKRTHLVEGCQSLETTKTEHDYVDNVCQRCPRNMWAPAGSKECTECPEGRVKKISGDFDISTNMVNMPTAVSSYRAWYYQETEQGTMSDDCALVPASMVHISEANSLMSYDRPYFFPVLTCPYGYSTQPGSYMRTNSLHLKTILESKLPRPLVEPPFMQMELIYGNTGFGETCDIVNLNTIKTFQGCKSAAESLGITNVLQRVGLFEGCWHMPSINPTTAFWGVGGIEKCLPSLQYLCQEGNSLDNIWSIFVRNTCFRCPGPSVSGPESGTCGNCFGNNVKEYMKEIVQKIAENGLLPMKVVDGDDISVNYKSIRNAVLENRGSKFETPSFVLQTKNNMKPSISDCYVACQMKAETLAAIKVSEDFPFRCSCAIPSDTNLQPASDNWLDVTYTSWVEGQPLCTSCQPGKILSIQTLLEDVGDFVSFCAECPAGFYTSSSAESNSGECQKCLPGQYQDETGKRECDTCPGGFYELLQAQTSCSSCQTGKYQNQIGMTFCHFCPLGYTQPSEGQFECITCPAGKYMIDTNSMECTGCLPGQYQNVDGSTSCKPCEAGRFTTVFNQSQVCDACPGGQYQLQTGQTSCTSCTLGKYHNDPEMGTLCKDCPQGRYADIVGLSSCKACPGGQPCHQTYTFDFSPCDEGMYLPPLVWSESCFQCEPESFANENKTGCEACPVGQTTNGVRSNECSPCPEKGWSGISQWNGMEFQTQEWTPVTRYAHKPQYVGSYDASDPNAVAECNKPCNTNSDCDNGLKCFKRYGLIQVPGCSAQVAWPWGTDLCYKPYETSKTYKTLTGIIYDTGPILSECQGPCFNDNQCEIGLKCYSRGAGETTPGCHGSVAYDTNICYDPSGARKMSQGYEFASVAFGLCDDQQHLPEGAYPPLLSPQRRLYDDDRVQECMNRCLDAYPGTKGFSVRVSDHGCTCSSGNCAFTQPSIDYQTFHVFESNRFKQKFRSYAVALSDGERQYSLFNAEDLVKMSVWQSGVYTGQWEVAQGSSLHIEQEWSKGQMGRLEVTCENQADPYNCHFSISVAGQHSNIAFYKSDPGSNYCALNE